MNNSKKIALLNISFSIIVFVIMLFISFLIDMHIRPKFYIIFFLWFIVGLMMLVIGNTINCIKNKQSLFNIIINVTILVITMIFVAFSIWFVFSLVPSEAIINNELVINYYFGEDSVFKYNDFNIFFYR